MPLIIVTFFGIIFFYLLKHYELALNYLKVLSNIIAPFTTAFVISFLLTEPINFFEKLFNNFSLSFKLKRFLSIIVVYLIAILIFSLLFRIIVPQFINSVSHFLMTAPENINKMITNINNDNIKQNLTSFLTKLSSSFENIENRNNSFDIFLNFVVSIFPQIFNFTSLVTKSVYNLVLGLIISVYMVYGKDIYKNQIKRIINVFFKKNICDKIFEISSYTFNVFSRFLFGKILDSIIIGIICFILMVIFNMPYALLVSFIVGVTNIIPFFGPFIGAIPGIFIILTVSPISALWFCLLILLLQQFDGNVLGPKILGDCTGLSGFWVIFSTIFFGGIFGFWGMLLGVPTFAVIYKLFKDYIQYKEKLVK